MKRPRDLQEALRKLDKAVATVVNDIETYLEEPDGFHAPEYFADVLRSANDVQELAAWLRTDIMGVST